LQAKYTTVGGFIFLRFFCPAILSPDSTSPPLLSKVDQNLRRALILISKSLQNLANGLDFGNKEPYMQDMNNFINENKTTVEAFFDSLAVRLSSPFTLLLLISLTD
jgi:neurofibromin 1